jgi:hypothetical protein
LIKGFKDASALRASGLRLAGTKYILLRADDRSIYGKQVYQSKIFLKKNPYRKKCINSNYQHLKNYLLE